MHACRSTDHTVPTYLHSYGYALCAFVRLVECECRYCCSESEGLSQRHSRNIVMMHACHVFLEVCCSAARYMKGGGREKSEGIRECSIFVEGDHQLSF